MLRVRGIHYDVGTTTLEGGITRPVLTAERLERDIADIATGLHANAVRITGVDVDRIAMAATVAVRHGLEPWLTPMLPNADAATTLSAIDACAQRSQRLRREGHPCTVVIGCELSVFMAGILPGATHGERLQLLVDPGRLSAEVARSGRDPQAAFTAFLQTAAGIARQHFDGPVTYASGLWEDVDWSLFDLIGLDAYRDAGNRATYGETLRRHRAAGLRVVLTETGCATYRGAAAAGGMAWTAVERDRGRSQLRPDVVRDEDEQAAELTAILSLAEGSDVEGAFIYTYDAPSYPSSHRAADDLDAASYALVRTWPDGRTEPKAAYRAVARQYAGAPLWQDADSPR